VAACVFDTTFMLLLTDDLALAPPPPPGAADQARDRLTFLLETLDNARDHIVLPTPVLTELLVSARSNAGATLSVLNGLARIRMEGFGQLAAVECAEMLRRMVRGSGPRSKVKFDHQIVAIAKVAQAAVVYSDDHDVKALCAREGLVCKGVWDLPPRPLNPQTSLPLGG
jgi:predicted nucleic acid-binding protein